MSALRQARIRQERERERIAESVRQHYEAQLKELTRSNQQHMIKLSHLEGDIIDLNREINNLNAQMDRERKSYYAAVDDLIPILEKLNAWKQTAKR